MSGPLSLAALCSTPKLVESDVILNVNNVCFQFRKTITGGDTRSIPCVLFYLQLWFLFRYVMFLDCKLDSGLPQTGSLNFFFSLKKKKSLTFV